ncbi:SCO family protein [Pusillimonas sp. NJUB218]|uniref:SCO family protein n=1 Tax=Pusillimonas sp. NJUB218 TaxID=2023230 RepID=UPI000F4BB882|nr:SCO family protein [Pusillimonas sp. NJUB218]ROT45215.1 SCO family protein [Pusillimonas sp. NJUB218]
MQFSLKGNVQRFVSTAIFTVIAAAGLLATNQALANALPGDPALADTPRETQVHKIRGFLPDLRFSLVGPGEAPVTAATYKGKVVMMFFGYASCPDICPTTMAQLSQVMHGLGDQADNVRILFISVDPHRDTSEKLQAYVQAFDTHAIGLTGSEKQIAEVARRYRVAYQIEKPRADNPDAYEVAHSRGIYIFDADGKASILASDSESVEALTTAVRSLLPVTQQ